jgi:hypothetical protein
MPTPKLIAIVTALILLSGRIAGAQYSLEQLQQIERYVMSKDCNALWALLRTNPELMTGTDPLAQELRGFVESSMRGQLSCFDAPTATLAPVNRDLALGRRAGSIY